MAGEGVDKLRGTACVLLELAAESGAELDVEETPYGRFDLDLTPLDQHPLNYRSLVAEVVHCLIWMMQNSMVDDCCAYEEQCQLLKVSGDADAGGGGGCVHCGC